MPRMVDMIRNSQVPLNLMQSAARGALSVPPAETIEILGYLALHHKLFGEQARLTLAGWDEKASLAAVADPNTSAEVLGYFVSMENLRTSLLPALADNPSVSEESLDPLAVHHVAHARQEALFGRGDSGQPRVGHVPVVPAVEAEHSHVAGKPPEVAVEDETWRLRERRDEAERRVRCRRALEAEDFDPIAGLKPRLEANRSTVQHAPVDFRVRDPERLDGALDPRAGLELDFKAPATPGRRQEVVE